MAESMLGLKRSHRCTEVTTANIGQEVTVMGWVQKRRNLGSLIFIDLRDRSGLLQLMGDTDGTVGYNGAGKFLAFFDECSTRKAEVMIRILQSQVDEYNKLNPEYPILFTAAWATASEEKLYHVRDLVRCAQKKMALIAEEGGAVLAGTERGEA